MGLEGLFVDREGAFKELPGSGILAERHPGQTEVEQNPGELRMLGAVDLLGDRHLELQEPRRLGRSALLAQQQRQGLAAAGQIEVVGREHRLADRQGTPEEPLGFVQPAVVESDPGEVVQGLGDPRVAVPPEPLLNDERTP